MQETNNSTESNSNSNSDSDAAKSLGILSVVQSVIAAMFGVRNHEKHEKDFAQGDVTQFMIVGVIFVFAFVLILQWIVGLILQEA